MQMRILLVTRLFPLPDNCARGTFVSDHAHLLKSLGHEVKILNVLPRMLRMNESRRSTMEGVAKAPSKFNHGGFEVRVKRHWELPDLPSKTAASASKIKTDWNPELIICHTLWPAANTAAAIAKKLKIPWIGVVHGHDFDVALLDHRAKRVERLAHSANKLVVVSDSLTRFDSITIPCHVNVDQEWHKPMKKFRGLFRKSKLDILFPADPRRPEKNYMLALKVGEQLESRGWKIGITTLQKQPRPVVWDRMLVADICLITSTRESGPLVGREAITCGCPVVAVDAGDLSTWMEVTSPDADELADKIEQVLMEDCKTILPQKFHLDSVSDSWRQLLESL